MKFLTRETLKKQGKNFFFSTPYFFALWAATVLSLLVLQGIGRAALWAYSGARFFDAETPAALLMSLRFDMLSAAYLSLPVLLCALATFVFSRRSRGKIFRLGSAFLMLSGLFLILIEIVNFGFFCEYQDQFNVWVLGMVNDDVAAIFSTVAHDFHWGRYLLVTFALLAFWCGFAAPRLAKFALRFGAVQSRKKSVGICVVFLLAALVLVPLFFHGGIAHRTPRLRDATFCADERKNRLILNPAFALKHVFVDLWLVSNEGEKPGFVCDVATQAKLLFGERAETTDSISALITKKNERLSPSVPAPKRVFLFVMESYDRWPMLGKYENFGLSDSLLAMEKNGASSENFVSGAMGTMLSLSAVISGIPHVDVAQNFRPNGMTCLPTGIVNIFKRLGYKTRLAYCGYGKWQHIADYAAAQGFDEIVLGDDVPDCPEKYRGEWGVPDEFLFRYLEKLSAADVETPVFTLVMSASFHPPYKLPLEELGCELAVLPDSLKDVYDESYPMSLFSHLKYADRALGKFVAAVSRERSDALFAVTGDHFSRRFLNKNPSLSERFQVPFVLFGSGVPAGVKLPFGTHEDIVPTLLALCAPDGFEYPSFGENLFSAAARSRDCALGGGRLILHSGGGFLYDNPREFYGEAVPAKKVEDFRRFVDAHRALAWHYFEKGDSLKSPKTE